jgi:hypothetical protein
MGATISREGKYLAYVDQTGLYVRSLDSGETHPVPLPAEVRGRPFEIKWFPDGGRLLAMTIGSEGNDLWVITVLGEAAPHLLYRQGEYPDISPAKTVLSQSSLPKLSTFAYPLSLGWSPDWRLMFSVQQVAGPIDFQWPPRGEFSLWTVPVVPGTGAAAGKPLRLTPWSEYVPLFPTVTADGKRSPCA